MDKNTKNITIVTSCALALFGMLALPKMSSADELTITNNGSDSTSSIQNTTATQTTVQQSNTSSASNNVTNTAATGNNSASGNSGNATIQTGDANTTSNVSTSANASSVDKGCCNTQQNTTIAVTGNGKDTTNTANNNIANTTDVAIDQHASVTNNISQHASTGNNAANGNNGNVSIKTGNISAMMNVTNGPINVAQVKIPGNTNSSVEVKIAGNGEGAVNDITTDTYNITTISVTNAASIINNLKANYLTGGNIANSNKGNVNILTGDVTGIMNVTNGPINVSSVTVDCPPKEHTKPTPPPAPTPQPTSGSTPASSSSSSSSTGSSGGSSSGPGSVLGAAASNLPVTGGNYWFFIALIGNILMMLLGGYLRLRSGRSPGIAVVL